MIYNFSPKYPLKKKSKQRVGEIYFFVTFCYIIILPAFSSDSLSSTEINSKTFGRLLTSADERARMDNILKSKSQLGVDRMITYRGIVGRSGGDWVWLNDQVINPRTDSALFLNPDKTISITLDDKVYRLKIGQTLIPALGLIEDPLLRGQITVR